MKPLTITEFNYLKYFLDKEYDVILENRGKLYFIYTKDGRLIFLTGNPDNILRGLKVLYGGKDNG